MFQFWVLLFGGFLGFFCGGGACVMFDCCLHRRDNCPRSREEFQDSPDLMPLSVGLFGAVVGALFALLLTLDGFVLAQGF